MNIIELLARKYSWRKTFPNKFLFSFFKNSVLVWNNIAMMVFKAEVYLWVGFEELSPHITQKT